MDVGQYLELFLDETKEHLQNLNTHILILEAEPDNQETIHEIFRAAHSLKGMSGTMGFKKMQTLTHDMESVFSEVRNHTIEVTPELVDLFFACLDALEEYTAAIQETSQEGEENYEALLVQLRELLNKEASAEGKTAENKAAEPKAALKEASLENEPWQNLPLDQNQIEAIQEVQDMGVAIYGIHVRIKETCILKSARAYLVFKVLGEKCEIIASNPSSADIEEEKFDQEFTLLVASEEAALETLVKAVEKVSEIERVTGGVFKLPSEEAPSEASAEAPVMQEKEPAAAEQAAQKEEKQVKYKAVASGRTVRVDIEKLDNLMNLVSELIIVKNSLVAASASRGNAGASVVHEHVEYIERITSGLHESVMQLRMVPIDTVVNKFPRMIRDLQKKLGKKMELHMSGEDTELDRTVVDEIGDPLMHLLRNAADHGLEDTEERIKRGKPETGSIYLEAYQDGNNVVIEVRDDGNGIDTGAIAKKAVERGVITAEQASNMSEKELIELLFLPSFSTAKAVTDVSGRGVGLDVVKSKIESLSGEVEVTSRLGEGSTWTVRLPLTLAIIQALMVQVGGETYAISQGAIQTIEDIPREAIMMLQNKEVIQLRGRLIPLIRLNQLLDIESTTAPDASLLVVIVKKGDRYAGLVIDDLLGQQEIVIKSLGKYMKRCRFINGATILGNGDVALIIDANVLIP